MLRKLELPKQLSEIFGQYAQGVIDGKYGSYPEVEKSKYDPLAMVSPYMLDRLIQRAGDVTNCLELTFFEIRNVRECMGAENYDALVKWISAQHGSESRQSGSFWYPPKAHMGWHTNNDHEGIRTYLSFSETGDSFFRYVLDGNVITDQDPKGVCCRSFRVSKVKPLWHCVYSDTNRISLGFNNAIV